FETETDTEAIAKLAKYIFDEHPNIDFTTLVKAVIKELQLNFTASNFPSARLCHA
ncbi:hypothetical protein D6C83_08853, partial [Aureobasidium pullulans]